MHAKCDWEVGFLPPQHPWCALRHARDPAHAGVQHTHLWVLGLFVVERVSRGGDLGGRIESATVASLSKKMWNVLLALGNIAFAYN